MNSHSSEFTVNQKLQQAFKYIIKHHDDDKYITGDRLEKVIHHFESNINKYNHEIDHI